MNSSCFKKKEKRHTWTKEGRRRRRPHVCWKASYGGGGGVGRGGGGTLGASTIGHIKEAYAGVPTNPFPPCTIKETLAAPTFLFFNQ